MAQLTFHLSGEAKPRELVSLDKIRWKLLASSQHNSEMFFPRHRWSKCSYGEIVYTIQNIQFTVQVNIVQYTLLSVYFIMGVLKGVL